MATDVTAKNLDLHKSQQAIAAYDLRYALRQDEEYLLAEFFPPPPAKVLDLGVGNGRTTVPLAQRGYDVVGIEYAASLVKLANQSHPEVKIVQGDARELEFRDETFDCALFSWNGIDYMHPIEQRIRVLREVLRVTRAGGVFVVSSHNALGCIGRLFRPPLLTRRAIRFWRDQLVRLRFSRRWYFAWRDDVLGMPLFYSAPPKVQTRVLYDSGWDVIAVRSCAEPSSAARTLSDVHVQYVCRKPEAPRP